MAPSTSLIAEGTEQFYASSWWRGAESLLEAEEVLRDHPKAIAWHFGLSTKYSALHSGGDCGEDTALAAQLRASGWRPVVSQVVS
jgi:hypothetical protein